MSDLLVVKLIEIINAEIRSFHELLELLKQEQVAIVADDLESIEDSVANQQEIAAEAQLLEAERIQVVEELSSRLNVEQGNMTLSRLIGVLESKQSEELAHMRATLLELNEKIRSTNENNAFLVRQSTRYTERCLDIITGQPVGQNVYGQFGKARKSNLRSVLNRTA
jgi:flagellar biosynthesis/type III secretory pathway chaperone